MRDTTICYSVESTIQMTGNAVMNGRPIEMTCSLQKMPFGEKLQGLLTIKMDDNDLNISIQDVDIIITTNVEEHRGKI